MKRQIIALQRDAYEYIRDYVPRAIASESIDQKNEVIDIILSENVILKVYDSDLILDLGARRVYLTEQDFHTISIG